MSGIIAAKNASNIIIRNIFYYLLWNADMCFWEKLAIIISDMSAIIIVRHARTCVFLEKLSIIIFRNASNYNYPKRQQSYLPKLYLESLVPADDNNYHDHPWRRQKRPEGLKAGFCPK